MLEGKRYAVIGSGMQGTAEGYDLARFGRARRIWMADRDATRARDAAYRINRLVGRDVAEGVTLDAGDRGAVEGLLEGVDACCGAAHYELNLPLSRAAIRAGCHFCDLGGNTGVVQQQHELDAEARARGVAIVPDCGLAPGMGNILAARAISRMSCDEIQVRCGGLPQTPRPPLGYHLVFSIAGLTNEYTGMCVEIRDGRVVELPAFTEPERVSFEEPIGQLEAFLTSGGTSTGPWSFLGKVRDYGYKTLRYPGHFDIVRAMIDLGLLDQAPVVVQGQQVVPRELFHALALDRLTDPDARDLVLLRVTAKGSGEDGEPLTWVQELHDRFDEETGFSAMERTTGFAAAIVAILMTRGEIPHGVRPLEQVVNGERFVEELARRDLNVQSRFI